MGKLDYLESDLRACKLCEWRCGVDRLALEQEQIKDPSNKCGVCGCTIPEVAASQLHPAEPASFDAFLTGCNFRCLYCQNWTISMATHSVNDVNRDIEGYYDPRTWAQLALVCLGSSEARLMNADRLFFTGGEPTCSLPWVEEVVHEARELSPGVKVNFDTNGFLTKQSLNRVLDFTDSITYDLKAFGSELFSALTGAKVEPVLRNLKSIIKDTPDILWEVRVLVIPEVHEEDVKGLCKFLADIDPNVKLNFLAFRPNYVMDDFFGATEELLDHCIKVAREYGLENVNWSGRYGLRANVPESIKKVLKICKNTKQLVPQKFAELAGCTYYPRVCGTCTEMSECTITQYRAKRIT
jgi:pyruvate formate lyase activating enzyme